MKKISLFLPVLTAIFLTLSLYAANAARLGWNEIVSPMIMSLIISLFYMGIFSLHPRTSKSMPLIASVFTAVTLTWYIITPYAGVIILLITLVVVLWKKINTRYSEYVLTFVMIISIIFSGGLGLVTNLTNTASASASTDIVDAGEQPNIYFIVFDRMPSINSMKESGLDPTAFVSALTERGFYVKPGQTSADAYTATTDDPDIESTRTMRFFASVLNLGADISLDIPYKTCRQMITEPEITDALHAKGYTFINVASWFAETSKIHADTSYHYDNITIMERAFSGELVEAFWGRSVFRGFNFRVLQPSATMNKVERDRQIWQMAKLKGFSTGHSQFIMAHILLPHEPFVWTADGKAQTDETLSIPELYIEQIKFAADYIVQLADNLRRADPTAVIIFQADEGMAYKKPIELNYTLSPTQWNGVFTAWYIPGADATELSQLKHTEILRYVLGE